MVNVTSVSFFSRLDSLAGDLIYLDLMGQPALLINSRKVANDLMDKRSSIYSDRPFMVRRIVHIISRRVYLSIGND